MRLVTDYTAIKERTGHNSKPKSNVSCRTRTNWAYNKKDNAPDKRKAPKGGWTIRFER